MWHTTACALTCAFYQLVGYCEPCLVHDIVLQVIRSCYMHPLAVLITNHRILIEDSFMTQSDHNGLLINCRDNRWITSATSSRWLRSSAYPLNMRRCHWGLFAFDRMEGNRVWFQRFEVRFESGLCAVRPNRADCSHQQATINQLCTICGVAVCEVCVKQARFKHVCVCSGPD